MNTLPILDRVMNTLPMPDRVMNTWPMPSRAHRRTMRSVGFLIFAMLLNVAELPGQMGPSSEATGPVRAHVSREEAVFVFPTPYAGGASPNPPVEGRYTWRMDIGIVDGILSIVAATRSPVATRSAKQLLTHVDLWRCPTDLSAPDECTTRVRGRVELAGDDIRLVVTDRAIIDVLEQSRPESYWHQLTEPGGRYHVERGWIRFAPSRGERR